MVNTQHVVARGLCAFVKRVIYTRSYYRKQNAADMYMQDVLQPKSVFFTVCMI